MLRSTPLPLLVIFTASVGALRKQHIESSVEGPKDSFAVTDYCNVGYSIESHASDDNHGDVCRDTQRGNTWTPPYGCERVDGPPWSVHLQTSVPCRAAAPVFAKKKKMPMIGFGTCCRASATGQELEKSLLTYFALGGKLVDTAQTYGNHKNIANAIRVAGIPREELWITTKINTLGLTTAGEVFASVRSSLQELDLKYIDLVLLHTAAHNATLRTAQWKGLVSARLAGLVGQIGVSNWNKETHQRVGAWRHGEASGEPVGVSSLVASSLLRTRAVVPERGDHGDSLWISRRRRKQGRRCCRPSAGGSPRGDSIAGLCNVFSQINLKVSWVFVVCSSCVEMPTEHSQSKCQLLLRWAVTQGVAVIPGCHCDGCDAAYLVFCTIMLVSTHCRKLVPIRTCPVVSKCAVRSVTRVWCWVMHVLTFGLSSSCVVNVTVSFTLTLLNLPGY